MLRRTLIVLPALAGLAAALGACHSMRNCQPERTYETTYYEEQPVERTYAVETQPQQTTEVRKTNPCNR